MYAAEGKARLLHAKKGPSEAPALHGGSQRHSCRTMLVWQNGDPEGRDADANRQLRPYVLVLEM